MIALSCQAEYTLATRSYSQKCRLSCSRVTLSKQEYFMSTVTIKSRAIAVN